MGKSINNDNNNNNNNMHACMHAPALSLSFVVVIVQLRAFPPFLKAGAGRIRITTAVQKSLPVDVS